MTKTMEKVRTSLTSFLLAVAAIGLAAAQDISSPEEAEIVPPVDVIGSDTSDLGLFHDGGSVRIEGRAGNDCYVASPYPDVLIGGEGRDELHGLNGDDLLYGDGLMMLTDAIGDTAASEAGIGDALSGNAGDDQLIGSRAGDLLMGGAGRDAIVGRGGHDVIIGDGHALQFGFSWNALRTYVDVTTRAGDNVRWFVDIEIESDLGELLPVAGNTGFRPGIGHGDALYGGDGDDHVRGGFDDDVVYGDAGNDNLWGGQDGADTLFGGAGDDVLLGRGGTLEAIDDDDSDDYLDGGVGHDYLNGEGGDDALFGGAGDDTLIGDSTAALAGNDHIDAGSGNDIVHAGGGDDLVIGGSGDDLLDGGYGDDTYFIAGGDGIDRISDAGGADTLALNGVAPEDIRFDAGVLRIVSADGVQSEIRIDGFDPADAAVSPIERVAFADDKGGRVLMSMATLVARQALRLIAARQ